MRPIFFIYSFIDFVYSNPENIFLNSLLLSCKEINNSFEVNNIICQVGQKIGF